MAKADTAPLTLVEGTEGEEEIHVDCRTNDDSPNSIAHARPTGESNTEDTAKRGTMDFFNRRSRIFHQKDEMRVLRSTTFLFDYREVHDAGTRESSDDRCIQWKLLKDLIDGNQWHLLRHPMILHFINERLIECATFYFVYLMVVFAYLLTLTIYIYEEYSKDPFMDVFITVFITVFLFSIFLKIIIAYRYDPINFRFLLLQCCCNVFAFIDVLVHVWIHPMFQNLGVERKIKKELLEYPLAAIFLAWVNFLYVLRKGPAGIYIFMMFRILKSCLHIATIWIPTLIAFSFMFHLTLKDSNVEPWTTINVNATTSDKIFILLRAVTKTSAMMIGEVDADNILGARQWFPCILLVVFEIITVILLMNLMISLAVCDVEGLRKESQNAVLRIKIAFVIEALQLSEAVNMPCLSKISFLSKVPFWPMIHVNPTKNVLVFDAKGDYFSEMDESIHEHFAKKIESTTENAASSSPVNDQSPSAVESTCMASGHCACCPHNATLNGQNPKSDEGRKLTGRLDEPVQNPEKDIVELDSFEIPTEKTSSLRMAEEWLIGLDWQPYLKPYRRDATNSEVSSSFN